jgi:hypothetical protein
MPSSLHREPLFRYDLISRVPRFNPTELAIHYAKHRSHFAVVTAADYELQAEAFLSGPVHPNLLECRRKQGDSVRYDKSTQEYGVVSASGIIRTYFKPTPCSSLPLGVPKLNCHGYPDNALYFKAECAKW